MSLMNPYSLNLFNLDYIRDKLMPEVRNQSKP